jgi:hypothetical protein
LNEATAPSTAKVAEPKNPVRIFESRAQSIWMSNATWLEKSMRLTELNGAINHYVARLGNMSAKTLDAWTLMSFNRTKTYLTQLAADVKSLSETSRQHARS